MPGSSLFVQQKSGKWVKCVVWGWCLVWNCGNILEKVGSTPSHSRGLIHLGLLSPWHHRLHLAVEVQCCGLFYTLAIIPRWCFCYKPSRSFVVQTWRALESAASVNGCSERQLINHLAMTADTQQLRGTTTLSVMGTSCCCSFCEMFKHTKLAVLARTKFVQFCLRDR